jgi:hypothetical protein
MFLITMLEYLLGPVDTWPTTVIKAVCRRTYRPEHKVVRLFLRQRRPLLHGGMPISYLQRSRLRQRSRDLADALRYVAYNEIHAPSGMLLRHLQKNVAKR